MALVVAVAVNRGVPPTLPAPSADRGALVFLTTSTEDGRVWQAAVLRVQFG